MSESRTTADGGADAYIRQRERVHGQLVEWRDQLIDLNKRNRLLNFKHTRTSTLEIEVNERRDADAVVRRLVDDGAWSFFEPPAEDENPRLPRQNELVTSKADVQSLDRALRQLERRSNSELVEKGLWTLYLAAGMLQWKEPDSNDSVESPVLLVPVRLERARPGAPCRLELYQDEDPLINPVLAIKLAEMGLAVPPVDDAEGCDVARMMTELQADCGRPGWAISGRVVLSLFSFHKEVMFRDLDKNMDQIAEHPLVTALAIGPGASFGADLLPIPEDRLDTDAPPVDAATILDADATQRQCIAAAERGASFVMDGPPGTGKSQTIANIIANQLHKQRSVLFVSEKIAALEVVAKRLVAAGLGDYVLELHSHKASRKEVAQVLGKALIQRPVTTVELSSNEKARVTAVGSQLSQRALAMNEVRLPLGISLFEAIGRVARLHGVDQAPQPDGIDLTLTEGSLSDILRTTDELTTVWGPVTRGPEFLWRDVAIQSYDSAVGFKVGNMLSDAQRQLTALEACLQESTDGLELPPIGRAHSAKDRLALLRHVANRPDVAGSWLTLQELEPVVDIFQTRRALALNHVEAVSRLVDVAGPDWRTLDAGLWGAAESAARALRELYPEWPSALQGELEDLPAMRDFFRHAVVVWADIHRDAAEVAQIFRLPAAWLVVSRVGELAELAAISTRADRPEVTWISPAALQEVSRSVAILKPLVESFRRQREAVGSTFSDDVLELDLEALTSRFETLHRGIGKLRGGYRKDRKLLAGVTRNGRVDKAIIAKLPAALEWQRLSRGLRDAEDAYAGMLGEHYYRSEATDFDAIHGALQALERAIGIVGSEFDAAVLQEQLGRSRVASTANATLAARITANLEGWLKHGPDVLGVSRGQVADLRADDMSAWCAAVADHLTVLVEALRPVGSLACSPLSTASAFASLEGRAEIESIEAEFASPSVDTTVLGPGYQQLSTDWAAMEGGLAWAERARELLWGPATHETTRRMLNSMWGPGDLEAVLEAYNGACARLAANFAPEKASQLQIELKGKFGEVRQLLTDLGETLGDIEEWTEFQRLTAKLRELGVADVLEHLIARHADASTLFSVMERAALERWIDLVVAADGDRLVAHRADQLDGYVEEFRDLDRALISRAAAPVIRACNALRPTTRVGGAGIILHQSQLKRRHMPVRQLLEEIGTVAQALKPCFMMSPLTVSQFLPADLAFDTIVFDEASQVRPADAINCIYRGKQLIVAGDDKQLPPTSFFESVIQDGDDEWDEDQFDEFESILGKCKATPAMGALPLRWHYRSQHESLIAYSNHSFYSEAGRGLITFPSAVQDAPDLGVKFHHVPDGVYRRGAARDNPVEARAVVDRVLLWANQIATEPSMAGLTVGVVAFSEAQADSISAELERRSGSMRHLDEFFGSDRLDGFFVKNLESVQGDERDVMIFSIGYGRDGNGKFTMNFGPLNREGGQRRLNVAITRARRCVEIVSSVTSDDFKGSISAEGVRHLQRYLDFAANGPSVLSLELDPSGHDSESPFEEEVIRTLTSWGYSAVPQVGVAGYRVDIGIPDPNRSGRFALGIECDGAMYHSSRVARDRDRLRQEVLEGLGWRIHRIWGTSWYRDRRGAERALRSMIESAVEGQNPPAPARAVREHAAEYVEHENVDLSVSPDWVYPYIVATPIPPSNPHLEMYEPAAAADLRRMILEVVRVEGPVSSELTLRRVRAAWGRGRSGDRIRRAFDTEVLVLAQRGQLAVVDKVFLAAATDETAAVRSPFGDPEATRAVEDIPPMELERAARKLVEDAICISRDELTGSLANIFGWGRRGSDILCVLTAVLDRLVASDVLTDDKATITLARKP